MAESSSRVRLLQHHLRQAGISLATHQLDAASEHINAALTVDPGSAAAITLRERLAASRAAGSRAAASPATTAPLAGSQAPVRPASPGTSSTPQAAARPARPAAPGRFIPSGVDAASWTDFEHRVQQRRFRALIEAAERGFASG